MPIDTPTRRPRAATAALSLLAAASVAAAPLPDFGPHVHVLSPTTPGPQQRILDIYDAQQPNHFGPRRVAAVQRTLTVADLAATIGVYPSLSGSIAEAARQLMLHDDLG